MTSTTLEILTLRCLAGVLEAVPLVSSSQARVQHSNADLCPELLARQADGRAVHLATCISSGTASGQGRTHHRRQTASRWISSMQAVRRAVSSVALWVPWWSSVYMGGQAWPDRGCLVSGATQRDTVNTHHTHDMHPPYYPRSVSPSAYCPAASPSPPPAPSWRPLDPAARPARAALAAPPRPAHGQHTARPAIGAHRIGCGSSMAPNRSLGAAVTRICPGSLGCQFPCSLAPSP